MAVINELRKRDVQRTGLRKFFGGQIPVETETLLHSPAECGHKNCAVEPVPRPTTIPSFTPAPPRAPRRRVLFRLVGLHDSII